jgi:hypothetical protein
MEERFDRERATGSVQFYDLTEVPAIRGNLPTCISQVRFLADLTGATTRDVDHFRASCAAAALLLPAD